MQGKILIIEDAGELADLVSYYLQKDGFEPRTAENAEEGLGIAEAWKPELVILDINLPGMDGFEFLQKFRRTCSTPVLIVSARDSDEDQISGLGSGADEYIAKPFSPKVLVARVRALFRRVRNFNEKEGTDLLCFGPFTLDCDARTLKKGRRKIPLSAKEFGCLAFLAKQPGKTLDVETIYAGVWKNNYGDLTTVAVYMRRLRMKLEDDPANPVYIETVRGMGYRLNAESPPDGAATGADGAGSAGIES
ncbi:MAG: response regulator transcription factor [Spirochaetaceae bacterium]|jgi:two-component system response regulator RegX3|nr:response regulator transcription factor [Spirochaetaceae bacterium]